MTRLSQIVAMISLRWPQRGHFSTSTENTRCIRAAQLIGDVEGADWLRGAEGQALASRRLLPQADPALAGPPAPPARAMRGVSTGHRDR